MKRAIVLSLFLFVLYAQVNAQPEREVYTSIDYVVDIAIYNDTIWCGTLCGGVALYDLDGKLLKVFTNADWPDFGLMSTWNTKIDSESNKWFAADDNILKFDGKQWTTYGTSDGLISEAVRCIEIDRVGNKWIGTNYGVSKFDGQTWTSYDSTNVLPNSTISDICADNDGNVWFATDGGGVCKFDGTDWSTLTEADGLIANYFREITIDSSGDIWFGGSRGISRYNGTSFTNYNDTTGLPDNKVVDLYTDTNGDIWCGTYKGVAKYDGQSWTTYVNPLNEERVNAITVDSRGNKWVGMNEGFYRFDDTTWTAIDGYGPSDYSVDKVMADSRGITWFRLGAGELNYFDGETWKDFSNEGPFKGQAVTSLFEDPGDNVWFGLSSFSLGNAIKYDRENYESIQIFNDTTSVTAMCRDSTGGVLFSSLKGVCRYYNGTITGKILDIPVHSMAIDSQGNNWFGCDTLIGTFVNGQWTTIGISGGIWMSSVKTIAVDSKNNKWFGAFSGTYKYDGDTIIHYESYPATSLVIDRKDNVWLSNSGSLFKFDGSSWTEYDYPDVLPHPQVFDLAVDREGNIWAATLRGIVKIIDTNSVAVNQHIVPQKTGFVLKSSVNTASNRMHVEFTLARKDMVELGLYDCKGKLIKQLMNFQMAPGTCNITFNCGNIPSGIYFCRLKTRRGSTGSSKIAIFR